MEITPVRRLADGLSGSAFLRANKGGVQTCRFPGPSGIVRDFSGKCQLNKGGGANLQIIQDSIDVLSVSEIALLHCVSE